MRIKFLLIFVLCILCLNGCADINLSEHRGDIEIIEDTYFEATITDVQEKYIKIKPNECFYEYNHFDYFIIYKNKISNIENYEIGDILAIVYNGKTSKRYPDRLDEIFEINLISKDEAYTDCSIN